jgi:predicted nuclease of predicted toxin-antitoxin system
MTTDVKRLKSRKQSVASSNSKPLETIEIFVDRCLGKRIGAPLAAAGAEVFLHDDHFPQDAEDHDWLTEVGKRGWIVLTKDQWIRRRPIQRDALLDADLKVFCFMSGSVPFSDMTQIISDCLPTIRKIVDKTRPPFIAGIYKDGRVKVLLKALSGRHAG